MVKHQPFGGIPLSYLKTFYREVLLPACLLFTVLCFLFTIAFTASDMTSKLPSLSLKGTSLIFLFSLLFSWSNRLFFRKTSAFWVNLVLHFLAFLGNIIAVFFIFGGYYSTTQGAFIIVILFALLYIIFAAIGVTVRHFVIGSKPEAKTYKRQFR